MSVSDLPTVNATLNASSAAFLFVGWMLIRSGHRDGHRLAMLGAFACSAMFLVSYLTYYAQVGSVRFTDRASRTRSGRSSSCPSFS